MQQIHTLKTFQKIIQLLILSLAIYLQVTISSTALADNPPPQNEAELITETEAMNSQECIKSCKEAYTCGVNIFSKAYKECRSDQKVCKNGCGGNVSQSTGLQGQELIDELVPSQGSLFGFNEDLSLTDGDLEQELAPRILGLLVKFSGLLGFGIFTYLGIRLVFARSDEETYTSTKNALIHTFVGAIIIAASFGIVLAILQIFNSL